MNDIAERSWTPGVVALLVEGKVTSVGTLINYCNRGEVFYCLCEALKLFLKWLDELPQWQKKCPATTQANFLQTMFLQSCVHGETNGLRDGLVVCADLLRVVLAEATQTSPQDWTKRSKIVEWPEDFPSSTEKLVEELSPLLAAVLDVCQSSLAVRLLATDNWKREVSTILRIAPLPFPEELRLRGN